jgi:tetratricopeptide (TPR) repeat protein
MTTICPASPTKQFVRAAVAAALFLAAACASAGKRYDQARELEAQGRAADAARRYVDALKKDRSLAEARQRLQETGERAIADYLGDAASLATAGNADAAADRFADADELRRDASAVGVELGMPADYAQRRVAVYDRAIAAALAESRGAMQRGEWDAAVSRVERAASRYQPTAEQQRQLAQARYDAFVGHARSEMDRGRFRSSFAQAARAVEVFGRYGAAADAALDVEREALRRGTVRVAIVTPGVRAAYADSLPGDFVPALWEALGTKEWSKPPAFVELVGRERFEGTHYGRRWPETTPYDAAAVARQLGADLAVVITIDSVHVQDAVTTDRVAAKTRAGADTAYALNRGRRTLTTRIHYDVVQVGSRRTLATAALTRSTGAPIRYATFRGDPAVLDLPRDDRDLFRSGWERAANRELVRELVDQLTERLGTDVYDRLLEQVP